MEVFAISLLAFANDFVDILANFATPVSNFATENGQYFKQPVSVSYTKELRDSNRVSVFVGMKTRAFFKNA